MKQKLSLVNLSKKQQEMVKAGDESAKWCPISQVYCGCYCNGCVQYLKTHSYEDCGGIEA